MVFRYKDALDQVIDELNWKAKIYSVIIIDVKNLEKGIKNLKKPGFNPKNKKP